MLHEKCVVDGGQNGEEEGGAEENFGRDLNEDNGIDEEQQHKKDG